MITRVRSSLVEPPSPRAVRLTAIAGAVGVVGYVTSWFVAGLMYADFDPTSRAISETFAIGAPQPGRGLMVLSLAVTGVLLIAFGWVLHHALPGTGVAAAGASVVSGVMTVAIVAFPCTEGCPGMGASLTDSAHSFVAAVGYSALVAAPLLAAWQVRGHDRGLMWAGIVLGGVAAVGMMARMAGFAPDHSGLQQRIFNTTADAWYVVAAYWLTRPERLTLASPVPG